MNIVYMYTCVCVIYLKENDYIICVCATYLYIIDFVFLNVFFIS